jgi:hypothetical protein
MVRAFEEEAGVYDPVSPHRGAFDAANERPLEGLSPSGVILSETGRALAAALAAGVFVCALLQLAGVL